MAALIPTDTNYLAQVASFANVASRPTKSPSFGGQDRSIYVQYTLLGTEGNGDTLALAYLPKGARLKRNTSCVELLDPGTTLTMDVGTLANPDNFADGMVLSAGGAIGFGSTVTTDATSLVPVVLTDNTLIQATFVTTGTLTAGVILYFTLSWSEF